MDFEEILLYHFKKYPKMLPKDAVKLCYQSANGCGHLIKNEETALSMLKKEMEETLPNSGAQLLEDIGEGYVRLDLHKAKAEEITPEEICRIFIESANFGKKTELAPKIELIKKLSEEGKTPFPKEKLEKYLSLYNGEMVSHSDEYRKNYLPAYRVVKKELAEDLQ